MCLTKLIRKIMGKVFFDDREYLLAQMKEQIQDIAYDVMNDEKIDFTTDDKEALQAQIDRAMSNRLDAIVYMYQSGLKLAGTDVENLLITK